MLNNLNDAKEIRCFFVALDYCYGEKLRRLCDQESCVGGEKVAHALQVFSCRII